MNEYSEVIHSTISLLRLGFGIDEIKSQVRANGTEIIPEAEEQMEICAKVYEHYSKMQTLRPEELYPYLVSISNLEVNG